eukprot:365980-Chlamydomonas_euryale.AAC.6
MDGNQVPGELRRKTINAGSTLGEPRLRLDRDRPGQALNKLRSGHPSRTDAGPGSHGACVTHKQELQLQLPLQGQVQGIRLSRLCRAGAVVPCVPGVGPSRDTGVPSVPGERSGGRGVTSSGEAPGPSSCATSCVTSCVTHSGKAPGQTVPQGPIWDVSRRSRASWLGVLP